MANKASWVDFFTTKDTQMLKAQAGQLGKQFAALLISLITCTGPPLIPSHSVWVSHLFTWCHQITHIYISDSEICLTFLWLVLQKTFRVYRGFISYQPCPPAERYKRLWAFQQVQLVMSLHCKGTKCRMCWNLLFTWQWKRQKFMLSLYLRESTL